MPPWVAETWALLSLAQALWAEAEATAGRGHTLRELARGGQVVHPTIPFPGSGNTHVDCRELLVASAPCVEGIPVFGEEGMQKLQSVVSLAIGWEELHVRTHESRQLDPFRWEALFIRQVDQCGTRPEKQSTKLPQIGVFSLLTQSVSCRSRGCQGSEVFPKLPQHDFSGILSWKIGKGLRRRLLENLGLRRRRWR